MPCPPPLKRGFRACREDENFSRYPQVRPQPHEWAACEGGQPQFDEYDDGYYPVDDEDENYWKFTGDRLSACNFPLGGFGCGRVLLAGDGTLKEWTVVNQCRADDGGPGDAPQPLNDMPANFFGVSTSGKQAYALISPEDLV